MREQIGRDEEAELYVGLLAPPKLSLLPLFIVRTKRHIQRAMRVTLTKANQMMSSLQPANNGSLFQWVLQHI